MPGTLKFAVNDVLKRIVEHTLANPECRIPYTKETTKEPSLYLVKDEGVYLMSASVKHLQDESKTEGGSIVAYAKGLDPKKDGGYYEEARYICGGDDFAELLPIEVFAKAVEKGAKTVSIKLTENSLDIRAQIPR